MVTKQEGRNSFRHAACCNLLCNLRGEMISLVSIGQLMENDLVKRRKEGKRQRAISEYQRSSCAAGKSLFFPLHGKDEGDGLQI